MKLPRRSRHCSAGRRWRTWCSSGPIRCVITTLRYCSSLDTRDIIACLFVWWSNSLEGQDIIVQQQQGERQREQMTAAGRHLVNPPEVTPTSTIPHPAREMKKHPQRCKLSLVYGIWGYPSDQNTLDPKYSFKWKTFHLGVHIDIDHLLLHVVHSLQAYLVNHPLLSHLLGLKNQNLCIPFFRSKILAV